MIIGFLWLQNSFGYFFSSETRLLLGNKLVFHFNSLPDIFNHIYLCPSYPKLIIHSSSSHQPHLYSLHLLRILITTLLSTHYYIDFNKNLPLIKLIKCPLSVLFGANAFSLCVNSTKHLTILLPILKVFLSLLNFTFFILKSPSITLYLNLTNLYLKRLSLLFISPFVQNLLYLLNPTL